LSLDAESRRALLGLARVEFESGHSIDAEGLLRVLIGRDPYDPDAGPSLAVVLVAQGQIEEAGEILRRDVPAEVRYASWFATRGAIRLKSGNLAEAIRDLRTAERIRPNWPEVVNALGLAEMRRGRISAAERRFREAARSGPFAAEPLLNLVRLLRSESRWDDLLKEVMSHFTPATAPIEFAKLAGEALLELKTPRVAMLWLAGALTRAVEPEDKAALSNNLGVAYSAVGKVEDSERAFAQSFDALPTTVALENRAKALVNLSKYIDAIEVIRQCLTVVEHPTAELYELLALAFLRADAPVEAAKVARAAIAQEYVSEGLYGLLSATLVDYLQDPLSALEAAREGLSKFSESKALLNNLAYSLAQADRVEEAAKVLSSVEISTCSAANQPFLLATTGLIHFRSGDIAAGTRAYDAAVAVCKAGPLRERLLVKRDLETALAWIRLGRPSSEVLRLLRRAVKGSEASVPYNQQAAEVLRLLGKGGLTLGPGSS
jgi:tetratricopeptide (TPR) repeat protein